MSEDNRPHKTTHQFTPPGFSPILSLDLYSLPDYPSTNPVVLFFHSGGLVSFSRVILPPWLVQTCHSRRWPLLSASYPFLPQASGSLILSSALHAYRFAQTLSQSPGTTRPVILAGASAGFSICSFLAHSQEPSPPPLALLSITGIPTFRHSFFTTSVCLTPTPLSAAEMSPFLSPSEPICTGIPTGGPREFSLSMLSPSCQRDPTWTRPEEPLQPLSVAGHTRGMLYDFYIYHNLFPSLLSPVDPGFGLIPPPEGASSSRHEEEGWKNWPITIMLVGDQDVDLPPQASYDVVKVLGNRAKMFLAKDQDHLFESSSFIEDESRHMDSVRNAIAFLDDVVKEALGEMGK